MEETEMRKKERERRELVEGQIREYRKILQKVTDPTVKTWVESQIDSWESLL